MPFYRFYSELQQEAKQMRSNPTEAEAVLWREIRRKKLAGYKFRRQHILGRFIVDYYCPKARLVVEVDGPVHIDQSAYDAERTHWLANKGYMVIRFNNEQVLDKLDQVLNKTQAVCTQRTI